MLAFSMNYIEFEDDKGVKYGLENQNENLTIMLGTRIDNVYRRRNIKWYRN